MHKSTAQPLIENEAGEVFIIDDWFDQPLPRNIFLDEMSYPDTSYSFTSFFSKKPVGFSLGYASGNYGHGIFTTGINGEINVGKFVVLQCTRIISNLSITIKDHCMFSWGSVITDSWFAHEKLTLEQRREMLVKTANSANRHLEFTTSEPVLIEENVWVGFEAIILPGVRIGRGAVVGCKSVVFEDVPPYSVVVGNPARVIKLLDANDTDELKAKALSEYIG